MNEILQRISKIFSGKETLPVLERSFFVKTGEPQKVFVKNVRDKTPKTTMEEEKWKLRARQSLLREGDATQKIPNPIVFHKNNQMQQMKWEAITPNLSKKTKEAFQEKSKKLTTWNWEKPDSGKLLLNLKKGTSPVIHKYISTPVSENLFPPKPKLQNLERKNYAPEHRTKAFVAQKNIRLKTKEDGPSWWSRIEPLIVNARTNLQHFYSSFQKTFQSPLKNETEKKKFIKTQTMQPRKEVKSLYVKNIQPKVALKPELKKNFKQDQSKQKVQETPPENVKKFSDKMKMNAMTTVEKVQKILREREKGEHERSVARIKSSYQKKIPLYDFRRNDFGIFALTLLTLGLYWGAWARRILFELSFNLGVRVDYEVYFPLKPYLHYFRYTEAIHNMLLVAQVRFRMPKIHADSTLFAMSEFCPPLFILLAQRKANLFYAAIGKANNPQR